MRARERCLKARDATRSASALLEKIMAIEKDLDETVLHISTKFVQLRFSSFPERVCSARKEQLVCALRDDVSGVCVQGGTRS